MDAIFLSILLTAILLLVVFAVYRAVERRPAQQWRPPAPPMPAAAPVVSASSNFDPPWPELEAAYREKQSRAAAAVSGPFRLTLAEPAYAFAADGIPLQAVLQEWGPRVAWWAGYVAGCTSWLDDVSPEFGTYQPLGLSVYYTAAEKKIDWRLGCSKMLSWGNAAAFVEDRYDMTLALDENDTPLEFVIESRTQTQCSEPTLEAFKAALVQAYIDGPRRESAASY